MHSLVRRGGACLFASHVCFALSYAQYASHERVSVAFGGGSVHNHAGGAALTDDGRYVAFSGKSAAYLAPNVDTNGVSDVFVFDRVTRAIRRVSMGVGGVETFAGSGQPSISADGSRVAFTSLAWNLVANDTNADWDVFVVDVATLVAVRASVGTGGVQADALSQTPEISAGGRFVVFESVATSLAANDLNGDWDVYWHDTQTGVTQLVSVALGGLAGAGQSGGNLCDGPAVSADGRYVAFHSYAADLVPGDTNGIPSGPMPSLLEGQDVFVRDVVLQTTVRVSVSSSGAQADYFSENPSLSGDGRFVVFTSRAANLVAGDTNGSDDVFLHDRDSDADGSFDEPGAISTEIVSLTDTGVQAQGLSGTASIGWHGPSLSRDATRVAFQSLAPDLVPGDTNVRYDVFVRDLAAGRTYCASALDSAHFANSHAHSIALSGDGRVQAFVTDASNLVLGDANAKSDVFVREERVAPQAYCIGKVNSLGCVPAVSFDGVASLSSPLGLRVHATDVIPGKRGFLAFSLIGPSLTPLHGAFLCVAAPYLHSQVRTSSLGAGAACNGEFVFDVTPMLGSNLAPLGASVWTQVWSRDGGDPEGISLSDALAFDVLP